MSNIRASLAAALIFGAGSMFPIAERALRPSTHQLQPRRTKAMKSGGFSYVTGQWSYPARDGCGEIMKTSEKTRLNTLELVSRGS